MEPETLLACRRKSGHLQEKWAREEGAPGMTSPIPFLNEVKEASLVEHLGIIILFVLL